VAWGVAVNIWGSGVGRPDAGAAWPTSGVGLAVGPALVGVAESTLGFAPQLASSSAETTRAMKIE